MSRDRDDVAALTHHYAHVLGALVSIRKLMPEAEPTSPPGLPTPQSAIEKNIVGMCQLLDVLIATEHKEQAATPNMRIVRGDN